MLVVLRCPHESHVLYGSAETMCLFVRLQLYVWFVCFVRLYVMHAIYPIHVYLPAFRFHSYSFSLFAFFNSCLFRFVENHSIFLSSNTSFSYRMAPTEPPPPEPTVAQLLALLMEDREAARAKRTTTLATLQHLATLGTNNNTKEMVIMEIVPG
jgi:hypothetical protein